MCIYIYTHTHTYNYIYIYIHTYEGPRDPVRGVQLQRQHGPRSLKTGGHSKMGRRQQFSLRDCDCLVFVGVATFERRPISTPM